MQNSILIKWKKKFQDSYQSINLLEANIYSHTLF